MKDFRREPYIRGMEGQIKVCKQCRCELCEDKSETCWPGPGV